ncbi:glycosyltransferase family 2 protein [Aurantiacibacter xanthus]|uniref:Glycosyltransferase family 2 protein n=1 Tax=Aurantiacibacter xanthus TaxID=1784712 RepID=A0A3A1PAJ5_9SPHN|nr:glycosyltransferase family 2 protein [Aurantiacibacter xanthus]RIV89770.1 glycosyltransferase family 2 protein [Aurantiacibacter xanthus]
MVVPTVGVIIAAYNAASTISRAVASSLAQSLVSEVIVIDDCSSDDTVALAEEAGRGDGRLTVIRQPFNQGPSAARNRGLEQSKAPYFAILDADDIFLPDRFAHMFAQDGWDMCADNICFTTDIENLGKLPAQDTAGERTCTIDLETFADSNIGGRRTNRTELGFLKPVVRRAFLDAHNLRYDETCRLGEDFVLYARMLALGARFTLIEHCGYAALQRSDSLSSAHSIAHLRAMKEASLAIARDFDLTRKERAALARHAQHLSEKIVYREILELRRYGSLPRALWKLALHPAAVKALLADRFPGPQTAPPPLRLLMTGTHFAQLRG